MDGLRCLIFIPTYNEAENVEALYRQIQTLGLETDYLFLDDNSPDGTGEIIERLAAENPRVHTIHRRGKLGIGSAHRDGIRWAHEHAYQVLVTLDCDFTHSPELIPEFLRCSSEHDVVIGSRYLSENSLVGWSVLRKFLTAVGHFLTTRLLRMPQDATGAFRVYRLDRIPEGVFDAVYSRSYSFFFESLYVLWLNNYRIKEIPISLPARTYGHSKMSWRDASYSASLLAYLFAKTLINRKAFLYAEPFVPTGTLSKTQIEDSWDAYWLSKNEPGGLIYELFAAFYRRFIIRPALNHFAGLYFAPGSKILHAGCGGGEVDIEVCRKYSVSALDISAPALTIYRKHNGRGSEVIHGSLFKIPVENGVYDGVYNAGVMEHFTVEEIKRALDEFHRVLKPDGKILLFWPPAYGVTVRFLAALHYVLHRFLKKTVKLHPDEITHVWSKSQVRTHLRNSGFELDQFSFGIRDLFTQVAIMGRKDALAQRPDLMPESTASKAPSDESGGSVKRALVTGITGQDGSYLAELLLAKGYEVHGIKRRSSSFNTGRIDPIYSDWHNKECRLFLHLGDLSDSASLWRLLYEVKPDEIYNLAAQSHVRVSFDVPEYTCDITANGALRVLEAIRHVGVKTRFYQASSSEMFGSAPPPQNENTPFRPCSPYACAKAFAHQITVNYRKSYNLFACGGILFNHESPRRGETFVTRKIARGVARIKHGLEDKLYLGNLEARRDWGYAPDYVKGMWMMLQQDEPDDYVMGTGESHSVKELVEASFEHANLDWHDHVLIDPLYYRPTEVDCLLADPGKARERLGWRHAVGFEELVRIMVDAEMQALQASSSGSRGEAGRVVASSSEV